MGELHLEIIVDRLKREFNVVRQGRPAGSGLPRNDHGGHRRPGQARQADRRPRPVCATSGCGSNRWMPAADSSSSTTSSAAASRRTSSRPSRRASSRPWRTARSPAIRWWTCASRCTTAPTTRWTPATIAFQEAARIAFKQLFLKGQPELLEPVMSLEVVTPEDFMGPVTSSICQRRGRIESMERKGGTQIVNGMVPLCEMFGYAERAAHPDPGPRDLLDALRALRGGSVRAGRGNRREAQGRE